MATLTKAADIAQHIASLMQEITVANGYHTDIGLAVYRGKRKVDDEQVPCAAIIEGEDKVEGAQGTFSQKITQHYVLGGYAPCDPDNPNDKAHEIIADIKRAIFTVKNPSRLEQINGTTTFGGRVKSVEYEGRDIGPRGDGVGIVFAVVYIAVGYVEQLGDA